MATTNTKTIKASLGDYTSLANWEAGRQGDLVALDTIEIAECYALGAADLGVTLNGWTTGPNNYIKIYTPTSERHTGSWDTTKFYVIPGSNGTPIIVNPGAGHIYIEGLQLWKSTSNSGDGPVSFQMAGVSSSLSASVSQCILRGILNFNNYWGGVHVWPSVVTTGSLSVFNNVMFNFAGGVYNSGILTEAPLKISMSAYNNTMYRCQDGIRLKDGWVWCKAINNLISSASVAPLLGTFANGTDYNATDTASLGASYTVTGGGNTHDRLSQSFAFENTASYNYKLLGSDTGAKGWGKVLTSSFTTDLVNNTRGSIWDIGAFQITSDALPPLDYKIYYRVSDNSFVAPWFNEWTNVTCMVNETEVRTSNHLVETNPLNMEMQFKVNGDIVADRFVEE